MYYVYRFLDKSNQIVYVGKTGHLEKRMTEHFSRQGHLTEEQYKQVEKIEYVELAFQLDMDFLEKYLINLWKPPFNSVDKDSDITLFSFNNVPLKWKNFDKKKVIKPKQSVVVSLKKVMEKPKPNHYLAEELRISNELVKILNQSDLTLNEHKLLNAMFSQINPEDSEFRLLTLSSDEIKKLCNFTSSNYLKREITKMVFNLLNKNIFIKEDNRLKTFPLIKILKYENDTLAFQFDDNLKMYLLNLKENFIQKKLKEVQIYKNEYALKLSLLFSMDFDKKTSKMSLDKKIKYLLRVSFEVEELKKLSNTENKYDRYFNFKERVLIPAIEDINSRGFFSVDFEEQKESKKVKRIIFFVSLEKNNNRLISYQNKLIEKSKQTYSFKNKALQYLLEKQFLFNENDLKKISQYTEKEILETLSTLKKANEGIDKKKIFEVLTISDSEIKQDAEKLWNNL